MIVHKKTLLILIALPAIVLIDRYLFALIAQWREDQGTAIYLGYHYFEQNTPIGILNTTGIPNPNGQILIAAILSRLPGLLWVSTTLGIIQFCAIGLWIYYAARPFRSLCIPMGLPLLSSTILRVDGAEFWGQTLFETVNIMFAGFIAAYIVTRSVIWLVAAFFLTLFSPTIYIAGAAEALNFSLVILLVFLIFLKRKEFFFLQKEPAAIIIFACAAILVWEAHVTWIPYFQNASFKQFTFIHDRTLLDKFHIAYEAMRYLPRGLMYLSSLERPINYIDNQYSLSVLTKGLLSLSTYLVKYQIFLFLFILGLLGFTGRWRNIPYYQQLSLTFPFLIIVGVFVFTAFLGGFSLHLGQRPDMLYRVYPLYLFLVFSACLYFSKFLGEIYFRISLTSIFCFSFINLIAGVTLVENMLSNKSPIIESNDVPIFQKVSAVDFIAHSWLSSSNSLTIPVDYDLDGLWTQQKTYFEKYYPGVFNTGIALDYEFERKYGLINYYRGETYRPEKSAKYVIGFNYTCGCNYENLCEIIRFGRVCVKINPTGKSSR